MGNHTKHTTYTIQWQCSRFTNLWNMPLVIGANPAPPPCFCLWSLVKNSYMSLPTSVSGHWEKLLYVPPYICLVIGKISCMSLPISVWSLGRSPVCPSLHMSLVIGKISCIYLPTYVFDLLWKSTVCPSLHLSQVIGKHSCMSLPTCLW